jgi:uncharacterized protein YegP (UPF0339 family)
MEAKFVIFKDPVGQYRFHLEAPNGEIIAVSEAFTTRPACLLGIEAIRSYAPTTKVVDRTFSPHAR